ncbi:MAG: aminopeptidase [Chloroflexi bacterium]|nr:aminopeptidase [Chloroflexota bacterium]
MPHSSTHSELLPGARVAVRQCLAIGPEDRVFVFSDEETRPIGEALQQATLEQGAAAHLHLLEEFGPRPLTELSQRLNTLVRGVRPTATFYAAQSQPGEIRFRMALVGMLQDEFQVRHGHMIGITPVLMRTGMLADYEQVARRTLQVYERVKDARELRATDASGTDLLARLDPPRLHWHPWTGLYHQPGQWGNLPEGETFTCPAHVQGVVMAGVIGDHFSHEYGLLDIPAALHINGQLQKVEHPNPKLAQELWSYLDGAENGRRVGELAIGTNEALSGLVGNLLQDEKYPGLHLAFGNPYVQFCGGDWASPVHVDVVPVGVNLWIDGEKIMEQGRFLI